MYSMVLLASLTTAGDTPSFGKKAHGGCTGAPVAACAPVVATGCHGSAPAKAPRAGFLGLCKKKESTGCTGAVVAAPVPCCAPVAVVAVAPPPPPAPVVVMAAPAGCYGSVAAPAPKAGFLGLCKKKTGSCH